MSNNRWTVMIKSMRLISNRSLKAAAKELGIYATYLFDVEAGNRSPTEKLIGSIIELYGLDDEAKRLLFDAAAQALNQFFNNICPTQLAITKIL